MSDQTTHPSEESDGSGHSTNHTVTCQPEQQNAVCNANQLEGHQQHTVPGNLVQTVACRGSQSPGHHPTRVYNARSRLFHEASVLWLLTTACLQTKHGTCASTNACSPTTNAVTFTLPHHPCSSPAKLIGAFWCQQFAPHTSSHGSHIRKLHTREDPKAG